MLVIFYIRLMGCCGMSSENILLLVCVLVSVTSCVAFGALCGHHRQRNTELIADLKRERRKLAREEENSKKAAQNAAERLKEAKSKEKEVRRILKELERMGFRDLPTF